MRPRVVLTSVAALALLVAPATAALAKKAPAKKAPPPKVYCNLLVDTNANDDGWPHGASVINPPALSIKSADVATAAKTMVAVLRLGSTNTAFPGDPWSVLEYTYAFNFQSTLGTSYDFTATAKSNGTWTGGASVDGAGVASDFKVLPDGHSIQWTIQRKGIGQLAKPKNVFHNFSANTSAFSSNADGASSNSSYPDKGLSCVKAS